MLNNKKPKSFFLYIFQRMIDWNWLWVVGEVAITYGCYRWWKSDDKFLAVLEVEKLYSFFK